LPVLREYLAKLDITIGLQMRLYLAVQDLREKYRDDLENSLKLAQEAISEGVSFLETKTTQNKTEAPRVFLSYSWANKQITQNLKLKLTEEHLTCWMDEGQMRGGETLFAKIDEGISNASIFVACISDHYANSENCKREFRLAVARSKIIIPLIVGHNTVWPPYGDLGPLLAGKLYIDVASEEKYNKEIEQVVSAIKQIV